jgi:4-oxalocrotonate tautomerase
MPVITLESPKLDKDQKKKLVKEFTTTAAGVLKVPEQSIIVLLKENEKDNIGVGGQLLSDK